MDKNRKTSNETKNKYRRIKTWLRYSHLTKQHMVRH